MTVGLLGLQGAFRDHMRHLDRCHAPYRVVRSAEDLPQIDRLILPGGESTVMTKFLVQFGMVEPLVQRIAEGMPVWGVCAGAILLARHVDGRPGVLRCLAVDVTRNAYGRQIASSRKILPIPVLAAPAYRAVFIRAPRIDVAGDDVQVHARLDGDPVFVQSDRVLATTFHPELNPEDIFHRFFLAL
jgi:5'-phosphate synthase pdxT subunit